MIVSLKSTPLPPTRFGSPILTIILDPRPSVDMVLPVVLYLGSVGILLVIKNNINYAK